MIYKITLNKNPNFHKIKDIKTFKYTVKEYIIKNQDSPQFRKYDLGNAEGIYIWKIPFFIKLYKLNFKIKYHLFGMPLLSIRRTIDRNIIAKKEHLKRKARIYFSVGRLAFEEKLTGIPRVVRELCHQGLNSKEVNFVPIYLDYKEKKYRIADSWIKSQKLELNETNLLPSPNEDCEITVQKGDWIIYTWTDEQEWKYMKSFQISFKKNGGKIGTILYDLIPIENPQFCTPIARRAFELWLYHITDECDAIFSISKAVQDAYKKWLSSSTKQSTAYLGYFHLGANFNLNKTNKPVPLPHSLNKCQYYMQVSTVEPRKGYSDLLTAFEKLWEAGLNAALVIVGKKGWMVDSLSNRIEQHKQAGKLLFWFKNASDEELKSLYNGARAIVFASEAEGFGLAAIEGLYYGKPVIVRDLPVFREIGGDNLTYFENGVTGLVNALIDDWNSPRAPRSKSNTRPNIISWQQSYNQLIEQIKQASKNL